ncbi:disease resistance protein RGA2-like [Papaver somniferum]|uniref:disease resistance protein RGA2-like n=1 Tax=Papaver somniferum TaxID=3469 RepID=UPI000E6F54D1|nr:disease resistance protein RGA2-like [Papaver somniferum]
MWICVSDDFNIFKILQKILESITSSKCPDFSNTDVLVKIVKKELDNKLYLLVLDDLWSEDPMEWDKLKTVLDVGAVGSRIMVTTRSQNVPSVVQGTIPPYSPDVLSEAECFVLTGDPATHPNGK